MSQSQTCPRNQRAAPLQNIIATSGESFICVGYNHPKERQVPQDRFCHCWKNNSADEHGHWDRRDLIDTVAVMTTALSIDENIRVSEKMTEVQMNKADLTAQMGTEETEFECDPASAAIQYAMTHHLDSPLEFLRCWNEGDFDAIRRGWPDVPDEVFIGADPLFTPNHSSQEGER